MPPMVPKAYRSRRRLAEDLGIEFLGPVEYKNWPDHWAETRRHLFHDIAKLGESKFGIFEGGNQTDTVERPWRGQIKTRATRGQVPGRGKKRVKLEGVIGTLSALPVYGRAVLSNLRDRLLRSEIEAAVESSHAQTLSVDERRKHRMPCRCPGTLG
ncbi:uncharacterized protein BDV17DRAFT_296694 [Aspergillus undulatus]|uniref:uncharacterized protein n=1 Tax=Aspergillus undulatus TaxID=1810928 RepID=UPI003CCC9556